MNYVILPPVYYVPAYMKDVQHNFPFRQQYPPIDTQQFSKSAEVFQSLMNDAKKVIDRFASSKEFAFKVMENAQKSNTEEVLKLIKTTGIQFPVLVSFTPEGIRLTFDAMVEEIDCCKLIMALHW
jgi:hypothetical protein